MTPKELYKEVKGICKTTKIPRNKDLALLKLKEVLQVESEDINEDGLGEDMIYDIVYNGILIHLKMDYLYQELILLPYYDVLDDEDNIIESVSVKKTI